MEAFPLHPTVEFNEKSPNFKKKKLLIDSENKAFRRAAFPGLFTNGEICGIQATTIPNIRKGISYSEQVIGTAFFIAPGVAISAWHVIEDFLPKAKNGRWQDAPMSAEFQLLSLHGNANVSVWPIGSFSVGSDKSGGSDIMAIGCHLSSKNFIPKFQSFFEVSNRFPVIGERLFCVGLKEKKFRDWVNPFIHLEFFESFGVVTDVFPNGRGRMPSGPCFAINSGATGGMSGAPVFDHFGQVVGILSTGTEDEKSGYSLVSSIAPVYDHKITQTWHSNGPRNELVKNILI